MFLEELEIQEKLLKQEQNRNYQQQQDEREDDLTELQIEENFTFLGIKNRQNRFINVRPNEFADITKIEKWKKYFERIQKDELFDAKITFNLSPDECKSVPFFILFFIRTVHIDFQIRAVQLQRIQSPQ